MRCSTCASRSTRCSTCLMRSINWLKTSLFSTASWTSWRTISAVGSCCKAAVLSSRERLISSFWDCKYCTHCQSTFVSCLTPSKEALTFSSSCLVPPDCFRLKINISSQENRQVYKNFLIPRDHPGTILGLCWE